MHRTRRAGRRRAGPAKDHCAAGHPLPVGADARAGGDPPKLHHRRPEGPRGFGAAVAGGVIRPVEEVKII